MSNLYPTHELARRRAVLAHLEAELELLSTDPRKRTAVRAMKEHAGTARRVRKAIEMCRTQIRRLEAKMPASDEI